MLGGEIDNQQIRHRGCQVVIRLVRKLKQGGTGWGGQRVGCSFRESLQNGGWSARLRFWTQLRMKGRVLGNHGRLWSRGGTRSDGILEEYLLWARWEAGRRLEA